MDDEFDEEEEDEGKGGIKTKQKKSVEYFTSGLILFCFWLQDH